jgi:hypothetical protein
MRSSSASQKEKLMGGPEPQAEQDLPEIAGRSEEVQEKAAWQETHPARQAAEVGHVDQAGATRWHQAQTELVGLIREENQIVGQAAEAERVLPDSLADWMGTRVAQLEQASPEPEASP